MQVPAAGESAARWAWLWPDSHSLTALARTLSPATWPILRRDPGALLLVHRRSSAFANPHQPGVIDPERFLEPRVLETVVDWFQNDRGCWIDWRHPSVLPIYQSALAIAHHARLIASSTSCCDAEAAWTAGMLAPLGWFAMAALDPSLVSSCRTDPNFAADPLETQYRHWGLDHMAIARRLARRWQLPDWLGVAIGHGDLPVHLVEPVGSPPSLFAVVQLAILFADRAGYSLGLANGADEEDLCTRLHLEPNALMQLRDQFLAVDFAEAFDADWQDPREVEGLSAELRSAIARRRAEAAPFLAPLERDLDHLHRALVQQCNDEDERLRQSKLSALAEFAAGASHEINNPLAVISGQSQYLLYRNPDEQHRKALESIVRQTQRVHSILAELMQFARPPRIVPQRISLPETVKAATEAFRAMAEEAGVRLDCFAADVPVWIDGDPRQLQTAIGCLVRNAIEATATGNGWVRVGIELAGGRVEVRVEDSGPGIASVEREHLFDPFYSGRAAGRGRGLGLPTAWRLAKEHGGDVRHASGPGKPTRFVLSLPLPDKTERLSA